MIDTHNHILPNVDDGAKSVEDSCEMAQALVELGVTTVCCTPHTTDWAQAGDAESVRRKVADLQAVFDERGLSLKLLAGSEAHLTTTLAADIQQGKVGTLNGSSYVLLEFPYDSLPQGFERVVFELQVQGKRPVIAHPERIAPIVDDPNILFDLVRRGCLGQLTAMSLSGGFGPRVRDVSELMVEHNLVHVVASDAHDAEPDGRLFALPEARAAVKRISGSDGVTAMFQESPRRVLAGEPVEPAEPLEYKRRFSLPFLGRAREKTRR
jgi:protein-tyrosine phosphatase